MRSSFGEEQGIITGAPASLSLHGGSCYTAWRTLAPGNSREIKKWIVKRFTFFLRSLLCIKNIISNFFLAARTPPIRGNFLWADEHNLAGNWCEIEKLIVK